MYVAHHALKADTGKKKTELWLAPLFILAWYCGFAGRKNYMHAYQDLN